MPKELYKLEDVIDVETFQKIQDDIAKATEMAILTVDFKGVPFTGHSGCQAHCMLIRETARFRDLCQKCDSRGGIEAARSQKPYIYMCHRGLVDLAVPIMVRGQYVGAMMAGQVQLDAGAIGENGSENGSENGLEGLETIATMNPNWLLKATPEERALDQTLRDMQGKLPRMSLQKVEAIANMLSHFCYYAVENACLKSDSTSVVEVSKVTSKDTPQQKRVHTAKEDLIQPALAYMQQHLSDKIYIEKMAKLCGVSESYFSKCFNQSTGMHFTGYVNQLKLERAKVLIESNNEAINSVSDALGFDSPGYFIKQFKAKYGVTPAQYRNQFQAKKAVETTM